MKSLLLLRFPSFADEDDHEIQLSILCSVSSSYERFMVGICGYKLGEEAVLPRCCLLKPGPGSRVSLRKISVYMLWSPLEIRLLCQVELACQSIAFVQHDRPSSVSVGASYSLRLGDSQRSHRSTFFAFFIRYDAFSTQLDPASKQICQKVQSVWCSSTNGRPGGCTGRMER